MGLELQKIIERAWSPLPLLQTVQKRRITLDQICQIDQYHRNGHQPDHLSRHMGSLAQQVFDLNRLSNYLQKADQQRTLSAERSGRIESIHQQLRELEKKLNEHPPEALILPAGRSPEEIIQMAQEHLNSFANYWRLLRQAELESQAQYNPKKHDDFFARLSWTDLLDEEISMCPPLIVPMQSPLGHETMYVEVLALLSSGLPLKIINQIERVRTPDPSSFMKGFLNWELLPLVLQNVFTLQIHPDHSDFFSQLSLALNSPQPGLISLNCFGEQSELANRSRAFPYFSYDPRKSDEFGARFTLFENFETHEEWARAQSSYLSAHGPQNIQWEYTFADFVALCPSYQSSFSPLEGTIKPDKIKHLSEYLRLGRAGRVGKTPFVYKINALNQLEKWVPSREVLIATDRRRQMWQALREISGVKNPQVQKAEEQVRKTLGAQKEAEVQALRGTLESEYENQYKASLNQAMKNLASRLTGLGAGGTAAALAGVGVTEVVGGGGSGGVSKAASPLGATSKNSSENSNSPIASAPGSTGGGALDPAATLSTGEGKSFLQAAQAPASGGSPTSSNNSATSEAAARGTCTQAWIESPLCTACDECITINKKIFGYNNDKQATVIDAHGGPYKDIVRAAERCSAQIIHPGLPLDPNETDVDKWLKRAEPYNVMK